MSNNSGNTTASTRFDAWGNILAQTGSTPQFGYTGQVPDATGLIHYRARYYDPTMGRFTQRDPAGFADGINPYAYVGNSPTNFTDPLGLARQAQTVASGLVSTYGGNNSTDNNLNSLPAINSGCGGRMGMCHSTAGENSQINTPSHPELGSAHAFFSNLSEQAGVASALSVATPIPGGRPAALVFGIVSATSGAAAYVLKPDPIGFYQDSLVDVTLELTPLPPLIEIPLGIGAKDLLNNQRNNQ